MDFAKQARIVDPRQIARLSPEISDFSAIYPSWIHDQMVNSGERGLYRKSIEACTSNFDLLRWRETMAPRLPIVYPYALRTLAIHVLHACQKLQKTHG